MDPRRRRSGLKRRHALGHQPDDQAGENIAGAPGGKRRGRIGVNRRAPARRRDHRIGALEQDDGAADLRRGAGAGKLAAGLTPKVRAPEVGKNPGELPLMGSQHAITADGGEEVPRLIGENRQRIGIQHHPLSRPKGRQHPGPGSLVDTVAGAEQHGVPTPIGEKRGERLLIIDRDRQDARHVDGIDRHRLERAGDGEEAGAGAKRRPRREARGPGHLPTAADDDMATAVFVVLGLGPGQQMTPERRRVLEAPWFDRLDHAFGDADIRDHHLAGKQPSWQQEVARLLAEEGDGEGALGRGAEDLAAIAVDTAWRIDPDAREFAAIDRLNCSQRLARQWPGEAGAEDGVDHQGAAVEHRRRQPHDLALPAPGVKRRVALELVGGAKQRHHDVPAGLLQVPGDDEPVAAIVAGPRQHDRGAWPPAASDLARHRRPRRLHQHLARGAGGDGRGIGAAHLGDGKEDGIGGGSGSAGPRFLRSRCARSAGSLGPVEEIGEAERDAANPRRRHDLVLPAAGDGAPVRPALDGGRRHPLAQRLAHLPRHRADAAEEPYDAPHPHARMCTQNAFDCQ